MNNRRRAYIIKNIQAYCDIKRSIITLEDELEILEKQRSKIIDDLYEMRSKEYIRDTIEGFEEAIRNGSCGPDEPYVENLLDDAKLWLNNWDENIPARLKYCTAVEKRRLGIKSLPRSRKKRGVA